MEEFGRFMNPHLDKEKFERLMDQMDLDKSGQIGPNEFLGYFAKVCGVWFVCFKVSVGAQSGALAIPSETRKSGS